MKSVQSRRSGFFSGRSHTDGKDGGRLSEKRNRVIWDVLTRQLGSRARYHLPQAHVAKSSLHESPLVGPATTAAYAIGIGGKSE